MVTLAREELEELVKMVDAGCILKVEATGFPEELARR